MCCRPGREIGPPFAPACRGARSNGRVARMAGRPELCQAGGAAALECCSPRSRPPDRRTSRGIFPPTGLQARSVLITHWRKMRYPGPRNDRWRQPPTSSADNRHHRGPRVFVAKRQGPKVSDSRAFETGDPGRTLTCDLLFRRQPLYTTELRGHFLLLGQASRIVMRRFSQVNGTAAAHAAL